MLTDEDVTSMLRLTGLEVPKDHGWRNHTWMDRSGNPRLIRDMSDMHVLNAGRFLYRRLQELRVAKSSTIDIFMTAQAMKWFLWEMVFRGLNPCDVRAETEVVLEEEDELPEPKAQLQSGR